MKYAALLVLVLLLPGAGLAEPALPLIPPAVQEADKFRQRFSDGEGNATERLTQPPK